MAHFAELDENNVVLRVIVVANADCMSGGQEVETVGSDYCLGLLGGGPWKQTSYNGTIRKNYAGIGYTYDAMRDAFIAPSPGAGWELDEQTCRWVEVV